MNLKQYYLKNNDCYKSGKLHDVKGIMVHSTGANNPWLSRVIAPDDGVLGPNGNGNHWNQTGLDVCVHAFIGKLKDGSIATYQTLPWNNVGWHSGTGWLGYAQNANNNGWIGFEIMEDDHSDSKYFETTYQEAVELSAYLCRIYDLDPATDIIGHCEGYARGIASNHSDPNSLFTDFGKNMDTFRQNVKAEMQPKPEPKEELEVAEVKRFQTIEEVPDYAQNTIKWLIDIGELHGTERGLDITEDMIRCWMVGFNAVEKMRLGR